MKNLKKTFKRYKRIDQKYLCKFILSYFIFTLLFQKKFFTMPKFWKTDENSLGNEESQPSLVKRNSGALNTLDTS